MLKYLLVLAVVINIFAFVECAMTPQEKVRRFPKWGWLLIILLIQPVGAIGWLVAGRPRKPGQNGGRRGRIIPPDDDPDFLRKL